MATAYHSCVDSVADISLRVSAMARARPHDVAVTWWDRPARAWARLSFADLDAQVCTAARGLERLGISRGVRTILMVPPGPRFFVLTFALFRAGATPVLIDPGMGRRRMAACLAAVRAEAFIGVPIAQLFRTMNRRAFESVRTCLTVGRRWFWRGPTYDQLLQTGADSGEPPAPPPSPGENDAPAERSPRPAAILFTTGSTGPPKGVVYLHEHFEAQVRLLESQFGLRPGQVDVATFPLFALFDAALGVTALIPPMDPTQPGFVDPRVILDAIDTHGATNLFGSPALLDRVGRFGVQRGRKLTSLRRVLTAGAPVRPDILERFAALLSPAAQILTPYGATEALPVSVIDHREILGETAPATAAGAGTCVGRPIDGVEARIIRIHDRALPKWADATVVPAAPTVGAGDPAATLREFVGEIVVRGPVVTHTYFNLPEATRAAKIIDGARLWHRMGDVGWIDARGRIWFCGRASHRVVTPDGTLYTEPVEALFNVRAGVRRTALVGIGVAPHQTPVLCVEPARRLWGRAARALLDDLRAAACSHGMTRTIRHFLIHPRFPVDIRHNAKIFREELALWAARRLAAGGAA